MGPWHTKPINHVLKEKGQNRFFLGTRSWYADRIAKEVVVETYYPFYMYAYLLRFADELIGPTMSTRTKSITNPDGIGRSVV